MFGFGGLLGWLVLCLVYVWWFDCVDLLAMDLVWSLLCSYLSIVIVWLFGLCLFVG